MVHNDTMIYEMCSSSSSNVFYSNLTNCKGIIIRYPKIVNAVTADLMLISRQLTLNIPVSCHTILFYIFVAKSYTVIA